MEKTPSTTHMLFMNTVEGEATWSKLMWLVSATYHQQVVPFLQNHHLLLRQQITAAASLTAPRLHHDWCALVVLALHLHDVRCVAWETAAGFSLCTTVQRIQQWKVTPRACTERCLQYNNNMLHYNDIHKTHRYNQTLQYHMKNELLQIGLSKQQTPVSWFPVDFQSPPVPTPSTPQERPKTPT